MTRTRTTTATASAPAQVGRPRRKPATSDRPAAEEILFQAGQLFVQKGYENTSTREIATASGLQQGSLFYYFPTKEDILAELGERSVRHSIEAMERVQATTWSPAAKLYRDLFDTASIRLAEPWDIFMSLVPAFSRPMEPGSRMAAIAADFQRYVLHTRQLVADGVACGQFVDDHQPLLVTAIYGVMSWASILVIRRDGRDTSSDADQPFEDQRPVVRHGRAPRKGELSPEQAAHELARYTIRGLLRRTEDLDAIVAEAMQD